MFGAPGMWEMMIIGAIALLLFGKRLPEVARSLGKGIVEFKKGVQGIEDDVDSAVYKTPSSRPEPDHEEEHDDGFTAPRFDPPSSEPEASDSEKVS